MPEFSRQSVKITRGPLKSLTGIRFQPAPVLLDFLAVRVSYSDKTKIVYFSVIFYFGL